MRGHSGVNELKDKFQLSWHGLHDAQAAAVCMGEHVLFMAPDCEGL